MAENERKLRNLYEAVEDRILIGADRMFRERIAELSNIREQAEIEADRIATKVDRTGPKLAIENVIRMARDVRATLREDGKAIIQLGRDHHRHPLRAAVNCFVMAERLDHIDKIKVKNERLSTAAELLLLYRLKWV